MGRGGGEAIASEWRAEDRPLWPADRLTRQSYLYGQCHALALALHRRSGWPLYGCDWYQPPGASKQIPDHVFIRMPDGRGLDISGPHRRGQHPEGCRPDWRPLSQEELERLIAAGSLEVPEMERAEELAAALLAAFS